MTCACSRSSSSAAITTAASRSTTSRTPAQPKLDLLSQDRRHRRPPLRHGQALRLHLDRDEGLRRQYPGDLRPARPEKARGSLALVDARVSTSKAARRRAGPAAGIACITRCASATRCGRAAGTAASGWSTSPTSRSRKRAGTYNYHPLFPEPTHTVMPVPGRLGGRRIALAIDEEDQAQSATEEEARRGRAHACILTFDVSDLGAIKPLGPVPGERDGLAVQPHARRALRCAPVLRAHVRHAGATRSGSAAGCASSTSPIRSARARSATSFPEPVGGKPAPQSNDVALDDRGLDLRGRPPRRLRRAGVSGIALMVPRTRCAPSPRWGEGWGEGVRGLSREAHRETLTPHPIPLRMGEGADRARLERLVHPSAATRSSLNPK